MYAYLSSFIYIIALIDDYHLFIAKMSFIHLLTANE